MFFCWINTDCYINCYQPIRKQFCMILQNLFPRNSEWSRYNKVNLDSIVLESFLNLMNFYPKMTLPDVLEIRFLNFCLIFYPKLTLVYLPVLGFFRDSRIRVKQQYNCRIWFNEFRIRGANESFNLIVVHDFCSLFLCTNARYVHDWAWLTN